MYSRLRPLLAALALAAAAGLSGPALAQKGESVRPEVGKPLQAAQALVKQRKGREALNEVARARGATLAQLATVWLLRRPEVTTVLIGASKVAQIDDIHAGLSQPPLAAAELTKIESILGQR